MYFDSIMSLLRSLGIVCNNPIANPLIRDGIADDSRFPSIREFVESLPEADHEVACFYIGQGVIHLLISMWILQDWRSFSSEWALAVRRSLVDKVPSHLGIQ